MHSKRANFICYTLFLLLLHFSADAQLSITGPQCVVTGTEYQYNVNGSISSVTSIQWCITGGKIIGSDNACFSGSVSSIRVIWQDSVSGNLKISALGSNATIKVAVTKGFKAGNISSNNLIQDIKKNVIPDAIFCAEPVGGSCKPRYEFQWEESGNGMSWKRIAGANAPELRFSSKPKESMYYRRRVVEIVSNTEDISNVAMVIVKDNKKDDQVNK